MARKRSLKVYGWSQGGLNRVIVAAHSLKSVDKAWRGGRDYITETGNPKELGIALAEPYTLFIERPRGSGTFHKADDPQQHMLHDPTKR